MQPTYMPIAQIFGAQTRHTVPLFQRPYVWGREEQWEPLWEDVLGLLERLEARQGEAPVASHFLGTIVLDQATNPTGSLPRREVIDGQQRLTTLQIMLKASEHALADAELACDGEQASIVSFARQQLALLTANTAYDPLEKYKVWPTNEDRAPFRVIMDSDAAKGPAGEPTRMAEAYLFFRGSASTYLKPASELANVGSGLIDRLGYLDPYLGGKTTRIGASANWAQDGATPVTALAYAHYYKFKLISNFTYFLDDPVHGDEFEQRDNRFVVGGRVDKRFAFTLGVPVELLVGADTRSDFIAPVGLYHTEFGQIRSTVRQDRVDEESAGVFTEATIHPLPNVRIILGLRADGYAFDVRSSIAANSGHSTAGIVSPKAAVAWTPIKEVELYANYGEGFHSNDGRGTAITVSPIDGVTPNDKVTALVKARGYEVGARARPIPGLTLTATYWWLNLQSELQYQGDAGETAPVGPSKRHGYELGAFFKPAAWLTVDGQYSRSYARSTDLPPGADHIPNALESVISAGVVAKYQRASAAIRVRHFGPYPIIEDNSVRARPLTVVNARLGYDFGRIELAADLINALDSHDYEIEYYYASRLAGEPLEGVNDRHLKPIEPRQLRLSATVRF